MLICFAVALIMSCSRSLQQTICSCTVPHERPLDSCATTCPGGGSGHGTLVAPSSQFLDNASPSPTIVTHLPTPSPHCYYPQSLPHVCCTLFTSHCSPSPTNDTSQSCLVLPRPATHVTYQDRTAGVQREANRMGREVNVVLIVYNDRYIVERR